MKKIKKALKLLDDYLLSKDWLTKDDANVVIDGKLELAELKDNLMGIEWTKNEWENGECPACGGLKHQNGHGQDCWLNKAIRR